MIPNAEQQIQLKQLLSDRLKFKDTFDEVYDHILTSLHEWPADISIEDETNRIIEQDLGGAKGLKRMQRRHLTLAIRELVKEYFGLILQSLTSAFAPVVVALTALYYFLITRPWFDDLISLAIIGFVPLIIIAYSMMKYMNRKNLFQTNKPMGSVRQNMLAFSGGPVYFLPIYLNLFTPQILHFLGYDVVPVPVKVLIFFIVAVHTFACYKIFASPKNFEYTT